jgi:predicted kinase/biotin operon repressor
MNNQRQLTHGTSALVIARNIRADIEAGRLAHGDQLPSTRELATEWGTSVATINRAMQQLADEGLVINKARSSRIVNYPQTKKPRSEPHRPVAILIGGYAGSGKTELGRILARSTSWPILDKDSTTRNVVEAALETLGQSPHDRESETYLQVIRPAEYQALNTTMFENLQCGVSAIVTAPFIREFSDQAWCDRLQAEIAALGADCEAVWVRCDPTTMRTYLRHRGAARDTWKLAHWEEYLKGIDLHFEPRMPHTIIDNSESAPPLQQQADELLQRVLT